MGHSSLIGANGFGGEMLIFIFYFLSSPRAAAAPGEGGDPPAAYLGKHPENLFLLLC